MRDWQFKTLHLNRGFKTRILLLIVSLKNVIPPQRKRNGFPQVEKKYISHQAASNSLSRRSSEWILTLRIFAWGRKKEMNPLPPSELYQMKIRALSSAESCWVLNVARSASGFM